VEATFERLADLDRHTKRGSCTGHEEKVKSSPRRFFLVRARILDSIKGTARLCSVSGQGDHDSRALRRDDQDDHRERASHQRLSKAAQRLLSQDRAWWTLVDFQASQLGSHDDVSFTINLGVNFAELRPPGEGQPSLGKGHLQQRIGALLDRGKDVWWSLTSKSDFDALAAEINGVLKQTAIPWLQERTVLQDVLAALDDDSEFLASWQRGRLSVLAERRGQEALADRLRRRYPPTER